MIRFIFNFFLFGFLFFLIWVYFPDAFSTLVEWAELAWNWVLKTTGSLFSKGDVTPPSVKP